MILKIVIAMNIQQRPNFKDTVHHKSSIFLQYQYKYKIKFTEYIFFHVSINHSCILNRNTKYIICSPSDSFRFQVPEQLGMQTQNW